MATAQQVEAYYREILGRAPDAGGMAHYLKYSDPNAIRQEMLGSAEYKTRLAAQSKPAAPKPAAKPAPSTADKLFTDLTNFDKTAKDPLAIYNETLEKLGIADARTRVQSTKQQLMNTENLLRNVEGSVSGRTQNSLVTEAQKQRLVSMEQQPLTEQMRIQGQNFDMASGDYDRIMGEGGKQTELFIQGQTQKRQAIIDRLEIAKDNAKTAEDKRRWQVQIDLQKQKMAQDQSQWQQEFDLKKAEASRAASSGGGGGGRSSSGGGGSSQPKASFGFKNGVNAAGGMWFKDANGNPISARTYAEQSGQNFMQVIALAAGLGDKGAQAYMRSPTPVNPYYKALTWR